GREQLTGCCTGRFDAPPPGQASKHVDEALLESRRLGPDPFEGFPEPAGVRQVMIDIALRRQDERRPEDQAAVHQRIRVGENRFAGLVPVVRYWNVEGLELSAIVA